MIVLGWIFVLIGLGSHILGIVHAWYDFDPRLSCDRLAQWGEWISCLHGRSHAYLMMIEVAVASWTIAVLALLLTRFRSTYILAIVPLAAIGFFIFGSVIYWNKFVVPYASFGRASSSQIIGFTIVECLMLLYMGSPLVGACLLGLHARRKRFSARLNSSRALVNEAAN